MIFRIIKTLALLIILVELFNLKNIKAEGVYTNPVLVETISVKITKTDEAYSNQVTGTMGIGDPAVIFHEGRYYLYPTGDQYSYYVYISPDLINWQKGPKVFISEEPGTWAPDVFYNPDDRKFYLYYTVNRRIGVAVADQPNGMFIDRGTLANGAIDAHMFQDENSKYFLYYVKYPEFMIYVQPMETPVRKKGNPVQIIKSAEPWEKKPVPLTEAPWMLKHKGVYYLLYSGGGADTEHYAIGYAVSKSPLGPFKKYSGNPVIEKGNGVFGPGHASVTKDRKGKLWMIYHQQKDSTRGWNRVICIDPLWFDDDGVLHGIATRAVPQPAPVTKSSESIYQAK